MTSHGKWSDHNVPHNGWTCVDVEDLGEPAATCQMCEVADIRYVHHMTHPDYSGTLNVGCICAENMEEDYVGPRLREKRLRDRARRLKTWMHRPWTQNRYIHSWHLNTEGYHLCLDQIGSKWRVSVQHRQTRAWKHGKNYYPTIEAAKQASLDALLWAKGHLI